MASIKHAAIFAAFLPCQYSKSSSEGWLNGKRVCVCVCVW